MTSVMVILSLAMPVALEAGEQVRSDDAVRSRFAPSLVASAVVFGESSKEGSRIVGVKALMDDSGQCHLFWQVVGGEGNELWHAVWVSKSQKSDPPTRISMVQRGVTAYSACLSSCGLSLAWIREVVDDDGGFPFTLFMREWNSERLAWSELVSGPDIRDLPCGVPNSILYSADCQMLYLVSYCSPVLEVHESSNVDPGTDVPVQVSPEIMRQVHKSRLTAQAFGRPSGSAGGWEPAVDLLGKINLEGIDPEVTCRNILGVFPKERDRVLICAEVMTTCYGGRPTPLLAMFERNLLLEEAATAKGYWPLFDDSPLPQVFPVGKTNLFFVMWQGPSSPQDGRRALFWSRSDTSWATNVLAPTREMADGMPAACFEKKADGSVRGVAVWSRKEQCQSKGVAIQRYVNRRWNSEAVTLPHVCGSPKAVVFSGEHECTVFMTTGATLRADRLTIKWE